MKDYTVEDYQKALDNLVEQVELYTNYENIYMDRNTLQHIVDLRTPKKVKRLSFGIKECISCGCLKIERSYKYCPHCGCKLDWSE